MAPTSAAQDEFNALFNGAGRTSPSQPHAEDHISSDRENSPAPPEVSSSRIRSGNKAKQGDSSDSDTSAGNNKMRSRYYIPTNKSQANTGPKGVIADAQAFQQARRIHMSTLKLGNGVSSANLPMQQTQHREHLMADKELEDENDAESEEDDEFMARWRQSRLRELTSAHGRVSGRSGSRPKNSGKGKYGTLTHVDAVGYLNAVERTPSDTVVMVFIFDDMSEVSAITEQSVADLAKVYPSTRFVKLHYVEAQMEPAGVPALLAYRGGDKFAGLVPVLDEIPEEEDLDADSLARALKRHAVSL